MDFLGVMSVAVIVGFAVAIPLVASRRDRFSRALLIALLLLALVIVLDLAAISSGFHDADGIFDCNRDCSTWQTVVGWTLSPAVFLLLVLVIGVVVREMVRRFRSRSR